MSAAAHARCRAPPIKHGVRSARSDQLFSTIRTEHHSTVQYLTLQYSNAGLGTRCPEGALNLSEPKLIGSGRGSCCLAPSAFQFCFRVVLNMVVTLHTVFEARKLMYTTFECRKIVL